VARGGQRARAPADASTRTFLEAAELLLGRAVTPGEAHRRRGARSRSEERGARSEEDDGSGSAPPRSRRSRVPADREVGRFEEGPWTGGSGRHGVPGIPPRRAPLSGTVCQAPASTRTSLRHGVPGTRLDAHLSRSGRAPARPGGHARRERTADVERGARSEERGARSEERGARSEEDDGSGSAPPRSRRSRVPADREVGRFEEGPWTGGSGRHGVPGIPPRRAPLSGTVCQASRLDAHLSRSGRAPARPGGHARRSAPQAWSVKRGARRRGTRSEEDDGSGSAPPRSRRSRVPADREVGRFEEGPWTGGSGRHGVPGTRLDAHLSPARCARHPPRRAPLSGTVCQASRLDAHLSRSGRAPARPGGHARRSAPQAWSVKRGARRRGTRSEEDDGSGSAPPRSRRSRVPADREVGRFEEGPWTGGSGRHGVPGIPPRRAPLSGTVCQASRLAAHLSRSGRAPARPGGHARRERTAGVEREARSEKTRNEERGGRRIGQRTAAIATLSRPGRPGGRPLRGRAVDGRQWAARRARHPASTRTSLRHGVPGIPPRRAPLSKRPSSCSAGRSRPAKRTADVERGAGARSEERGGRRIGQRTAAIATLSRPGRPGGRPLRGRAVDGRQWAARCARHPASTRTSLRHGVPGTRLDAHLSRSGRAPARPGGTPGESAPQTWSEERGARRTTDRAAHRRDRDALASRPTGRSAASRKGRGRAAVGGTVCQASRLDAHLSPARCARHPASTRTSLDAVCQASRLDAHLSRSGRAPARPGGHARRSAPQTWSEEDDGSGSAPPRSRRSRVPADREVGRFEEGPGDGRQWAARCARHPASTRTSLDRGREARLGPGPPSLRTGRADLPHPALRLVVTSKRADGRRQRLHRGRTAAARERIRLATAGGRSRARDRASSAACEASSAAASGAIGREV
jgi:hypothetical protein